MRFFLSVLVLFLIACSKDSINPYIHKPDGCDSMLFTYENRVQPILQSYCNFDECHGTGGKGSYDFTMYEGILRTVKAGTLLYRLGLSPEDPQHMPEGLRMNACDYYALVTWVNQGALEK